MSDLPAIPVVFVHGWSVTHTSTYGDFPERLRREARARAGLNLDIRNIWLGKYVSFHDEVRVADIAKAFEAAIRTELSDVLQRGVRFACITHSTGGPVIREWWDAHYVARGRPGACPMSHLVMLAPANFGSALGQLGKGRIGRLKSWFGGVEPGTGVLDWLELGSPEAWRLNRRWMSYPDTTSGRGRVFPFVLTGQCVDHALYDHVNSYTGELGSDGVVRAAAANLNTTYVRLEQETPVRSTARGRPYQAPLKVAERGAARETAFAIVPGVAHSGTKMGIMRSVRDDRRDYVALDNVIACLMVTNARGYRALVDEFRAQTAQVQQDEIVERRDRILLADHRRIRDQFSMVVFRLSDSDGYPVTDYDIVLTAGRRESPDHLPAGLLKDSQRNSKHRENITFYFNHGILSGRGVPGLREPARRLNEFLGLRVLARADRGFAHYGRATLSAAAGNLMTALRPNQTVMVDIVLKRIVHEGTFALTRNTTPESFRGVEPGDEI